MHEPASAVQDLRDSLDALAGAHNHDGVPCGKGKVGRWGGDHLVSPQYRHDGSTGSGPRSRIAQAPPSIGRSRGNWNLLTDKSGDLFPESIQTLNDAWGAEQLGEGIRFVAGQRNCFTAGVRIRWIVYQQIPSPGAVRDYANPPAPPRHEVMAEPDAGKGSLFDLNACGFFGLIPLLHGAIRDR